MLKKRLLTLLALLLVALNLWGFTVPTSKGDVELTIPEHMSLEEAYVEMARLYLEERYDHEELIAATERQSTSVSSYIIANQELRKQYQSLLKDYNLLVESMQTEIKGNPLRGFLGIEVDFEEKFSIMKPSILVGCCLFERFLITTRFSYPWSIGIGLGTTF